MSQSEKTMMRYLYATEKLGLAQGDFARTSNSWANQTRVLSEQFNVLKTEIGKSLIQVLTPFLKVLNDIVAKLIEGAKALNNFTAKLFGKQEAAASDTTDAVNDTSQAYDGLGDSITGAANAAKKAVLGIDEINKLRF